MTKHVVLEAPDETFVDGLVAAGRFDTPDHAVKEGLRLLHEREARLAEWRDAWHEGVESGDYRPAADFFAGLSGRYGPDGKAGG
jgi:antitoxin ParD1/3/4